MKMYKALIMLLACTMLLSLSSCRDKTVAVKPSDIQDISLPGRPGDPFESLIDNSTAVELPEYSIIPIDEKSFPDESLRAIVQKNCDKNGDGALSRVEIKVSTALTLVDFSLVKAPIESLKGLELLTSLKSLQLYNLRISSLELKLPTLEYLDCQKQGIGYLDVRGCPSLVSLDIRFNDITWIDLSQNPRLRSLYVQNCNLQMLDLSNNPLIQDLYCQNNDIIELELSGFEHLRNLDCTGNRFIKELDLSKKPGLTTVACGGNKLTTLDLRDSKELESLNCDNNELESLLVYDVKSISCTYNRPGKNGLCNRYG